MPCGIHHPLQNIPSPPPATAHAVAQVMGCVYSWLQGRRCGMAAYDLAPTGRRRQPRRQKPAIAAEGGKEWCSQKQPVGFVFLRNYGPIPTNDNMYDETIQRALRRHRIDPLVIAAQFLDGLLANFQSDNPRSEILTGTAGDGKTYHSRETWLRLGGDEGEWNAGRKVQKLPLGSRELGYRRSHTRSGARVSYRRKSRAAP